MLDKAMDKLINISPSTLHEGSTIPAINQTIPRQSLLTLGKPPGRIECQILSQWIGTKLSNISNYKVEDDGFERLVYEFATLELIRQVSVQCTERGYLFKKMINGLKKTYDQDLERLRCRNIEEQADLRLRCSEFEEQLKKKLGELIAVFK
jgi:hypothetical protein